MNKSEYMRAYRQGPQVKAREEARKSRRCKESET